MRFLGLAVAAARQKLPSHAVPLDPRHHLDARCPAAAAPRAPVGAPRTEANKSETPSLRHTKGVFFARRNESSENMFAHQ